MERIGESSGKVRRVSAKGVYEDIPVVPDHAAATAIVNTAPTDPGVISQDYSPTTIAVVPTNEELQIAVDAYDIVFG